MRDEFMQQLRAAQIAAGMAPATADRIARQLRNEFGKKRIYVRPPEAPERPRRNATDAGGTSGSR